MNKILHLHLPKSSSCKDKLCINILTRLYNMWASANDAIQCSANCTDAIIKTATTTTNGIRCNASQSGTKKSFAHFPKTMELNVYFSVFQESIFIFVVAVDVRFSVMMVIRLLRWYRCCHRFIIFPQYFVGTNLMIHGETKSNEEFMIFPTHRIPTSNR